MVHRVLNGFNEHYIHIPLLIPLISFLPLLSAKEEATIFTKNKYGFEEKTGSVRESSSKDRKDIYTKNKYDSKRRRAPSRIFFWREKRCLFKKQIRV